MAKLSVTALHSDLSPSVVFEESYQLTDLHRCFTPCIPCCGPDAALVFPHRKPRHLPNRNVGIIPFHHNRRALVNNSIPALAIAVVILLLPSPLFAQETNPSGDQGFFEKTADWGSPKSPPQQGQYKVPGRIEVSEEDGETVYHIYGNGDDIWFTIDEGFFAYTERKGSWSLSCAVRYIDDGSSDTYFSKLGVMVREPAQEADAPVFYSYLRSGPNPPYGDMVSVQWREEKGAFGGSLTAGTRGAFYDAMPHPELGQPVYIRVTRFLPFNLLLSEWSQDGETWETLTIKEVDLPKKVAYGVAITNHADNTELAHGVISDVRMEPAPPFATRNLLKRHYTTGDSIGVTLNIVNPSDSPQDATIVESIPAGWVAEGIGNDGALGDGEIRWSLPVPPGSTDIAYTLRPTQAATGIATLSGKAGNLAIQGQATICGNLGIFENIADWGTWEFPPMTGLNKAAGNVIVSGSGENQEYDLYGNGNFTNWQDEGLYLYAERDESWTISAKIDSFERTSGRSYVALEIRNRPDDVYSAYYGIGVFGNNLGISYRYARRTYYTNKSVSNPDNQNIPMPESGVFLRITRIASANLVFSEWSLDGETWHFADQRVLPMNPRVGYGIDLANGEDNEELAHARASRVSLSRPEPVAIRSLSHGYYSAGEPLDVTLEIVHAGDQPREVTLREQPPSGWTIEAVSHAGRHGESGIEWDLLVEPGSTFLTYRAIPSSDVTGDAEFVGRLNGRPVLGNETAQQAESDFWSLPGHLWRYWSAADGFFGSRTRLARLSISPNGAVITHKGSNSDFIRLDGYSVQTIPGIGRSLPVEGASREIWSVSRERVGFNEYRYYGLERYREGHWTSYPVEEILNTAQPLTLIPSATNRVLIFTPDQLLHFDAVSKRTTTILDATAAGLPYLVGGEIVGSGGVRKENIVRDRGSAIWIAAWGKLTKIQIQDDDEPRVTELTQYSVHEEFNLQDIIWPREAPSGGLTFLGWLDNGSRTVPIYFDGTSSWQTIEGDTPYIALTILDSNRVPWMLNLLTATTIYLDHDGVSLPVRNEFLFGQTLDISNDPASGLWVLTRSGAARRSPHLWKTPPGIAKYGDRVFSIFEDGTGTLWFNGSDRLVKRKNGEWKTYPYGKNAMRGTGIDFGLPYLPRLFRTPNGLLYTGCCVPSETGRPTSLWFHPKNSTFQFDYRPDTHQTYSEYPGRNGYHWSAKERVFGSGQLVCRNDEEDIRYINSALVHDARTSQWLIPSFVVEEENGDLWIGQDEVRRIRSGESTVYGPEEGYNGGYAWCMLTLSDGRKWVGGENGIYEFENERWRVVRSDLTYVRTLLQSADNSVWVGTNDGVYVLRNGVWNSFTVEEGLPSNTIYHLYQDSRGDIWAATEFGISRFNPDADTGPPEAIVREEEYSSEIAAGVEMRIGYTGIDKWKYTDPSRLTFSTRLDGGEWSEFSSETVFSAANLSAGEHTFEVRARDRNWNIGPVPAVWTFNVLLPWYREPAFLTIMFVGGLVVLLLAGLTIKHYVQLRHAYAEVRCAQMELQAANEEMEAANEELYATNEFLNEANEQLRELDKMKSAFVSQASHDLRTPLTAIKGTLDNLGLGIGGELTEKQKKLLDRAHRSVDRLTALVNDILDLARMESGRMTLEKSDFSMKMLVENMLHENKTAAAQKNISLSLNAGDEPLKVNADMGKLGRVVGELIGNAIKYTPDGGTVEINLAQQDDKAAVTVRDSGIGMTREECEKIWDRFYRTTASQKIARGSGLGLSIAKELIEMHGGTIQAESEPGKGTTFVVTVPSHLSQS